MKDKEDANKATSPTDPPPGAGPTPLDTLRENVLKGVREADEHQLKRLAEVLRGKDTTPDPSAAREAAVETHYSEHRKKLEALRTAALTKPPPRT